MFRGNHPARVDEKGRLKIPADFKREFPEKQEFYVTSLDGKRAQLYPIAEWEKKEEVLAKMPSTSVAKIKFLDVTSYYGQMVEMDTQGRVLLPQILRESARVDGEVVVLGKQGILEVVNHDDFKAEMVKAPLSMQDMAALAEFGL
ncbi:division/cell wall cluster transcriptional repressor MraZ [Granulicella tundricola]|uniref:Transcriptional regulator MraZ n=1 Tax=Granulicella tundricola (strain ATCC BAA-1859 / DSM 23138 / MP5ACTX9) TaxID=1198114 RepID=E8WXA4_GRATM|nr:MraZ family transcriptional regulator [Granulicella tundricola]ADW69746.1 MraZ domain protein [Granulicella tundricola MP5ACTX9]